METGITNAGVWVVPSRYDPNTLEVGASAVVRTCFNPFKVRSKPREQYQRSQEQMRVSIPSRYDPNFQKPLDFSCKVY